MPKRNGNKKTAIAAALFRATVAAAVIGACLFTGGCGKKLRYDLPIGKTLRYGFFSDAGHKYLENGEEKIEPYPFFNKSMEMEMSVVDYGGGVYTLNVTALAPGKKVNPLLGKKLGFVTLHVKPDGQITDMTGMGVPFEMRLMLPQFSGGRVKMKGTWIEPIRSDFLLMNNAKVGGGENKPADLTLKHTYLGRTVLSGRRCYHIKGEAEYKKKEEIPNKEQNITGNFDFEYTYREDFYFSDEGYPLLMKVKENKGLVITDSDTNEIVYYDKEYLNQQVIMLRME